MCSIIAEMQGGMAGEVVPALAGEAVPVLAGMLGAKKMALTQGEAETKWVCSKEETNQADGVLCQSAGLHWTQQEGSGLTQSSESNPGLPVLLCAFLTPFLNHQWTFLWCPQRGEGSTGGAKLKEARLEMSPSHLSPLIGKHSENER